MPLSGLPDYLAHTRHVLRYLRLIGHRLLIRLFFGRVSIRRRLLARLSLLGFERLGLLDCLLGLPRATGVAVSVDDLELVLDLIGQLLQVVHGETLPGVRLVERSSEFPRSSSADSD